MVDRGRRGARGRGRTRGSTCASSGDSYASNRSPVERAREEVVVDAEEARRPAGCRRSGAPRVTTSPASPDLRIRSVSPLSSSNACFTSFGDRERVVRDEHDLGRRLVRPPPQPAPARAAPPCSERHSGALDARRVTRARPGRMASRTPSLDRDARRVGREDVRDAAARARARASRRAAGTRRPSVRHALGRPVDASSETSSPGFPRVVRSSRTTCTRAAPTNASICRCGVAVGAEQEQRREQVVEPAAVAARGRGCARAERDRGVERELEIGRVLLRRVTLDAYAGGLRDRDGLGRGRVEVADREGRRRDRARARARAPGRRRRRARRAGRREAGARAGGSPPDDDHDDLFRHAFLRWHYPDQVLRVGGALSPPSQPGCPSSPLRPGHRSAGSAAYARA